MLFLLVVFSLGFFSATVIALAALWSFYTYQSRHDKLHAAATASVLDRDQILQLFSEDTGGLPSYLRDPDAHHCTWLNTAMEVLWPSIGKAATAWAFKDRNLETLMNSQTFWKPDFLAGSTGIVLQNLELGEKPPQVSAVKIYSSIVSANKSEALIADASFEWSSSMEMTISMKTLEDGGPKSTLDRFVSAVYKTVTIRVVIRDVVARGQLRIIAAPLLSELPVIGTVRASFLGKALFYFYCLTRSGMQDCRAVQAGDESSKIALLSLCDVGPGGDSFSKHSHPFIHSFILFLHRLQVPPPFPTMSAHLVRTH